MSEGSPRGEDSEGGAQADCLVVDHSHHQSEEAGGGGSASSSPRAESLVGITLLSRGVVQGPPLES